MLTSAIAKLRSYRAEIAIFLSYVIVTFIYTYPGMLNMTGKMYAFHGDALTGFGVWWISYALLHHLSPYFSPLVASPFGMNTPTIEWGTMGPLVALTLLVNETFAYNFMMILSFPLAAMTMYCLCYHITKNKTASMVAGLIYAFCPNHVWKSYAFVDQTVGMQWIPLYVLFLLKLREERTYKNAILTGALFALVLLTSFINGYMVAIFTAYFVLFDLGYVYLTKRKLDVDWQIVKVAAAALLTCIVAILPFTYSLLREMITTPAETASYMLARPFGHLSSLAARPVDYLLPSYSHPLFGPLISKLVPSDTMRGEFTHGLYIGYAALCLAAYGLWRWRRGVKRSIVVRRQSFTSCFFAFSFLAALILSTPPTLALSRLPLVGRWEILTPSYFLYALAPWFREYARFGLIVTLSVAPLAGLGLYYLLRSITHRRLKYLTACLVILLVLFEYFPSLPVPVVGTEKIPPEYQWLANQPGNFAVAEYPMHDRFIFPDYLHYIRVHGKRIVNGGHTGRVADMVMPSIQDITSVSTPSVLRYLGAKYVVIHKIRADQSHIPTDLTGLLHFQLVEDFETATIYSVHADPAQVIASPTAGFEFMARREEDERASGWWVMVAEDVEVTLLNVTTTPLNIDLHLRARTDEMPQLLEVSCNGSFLENVTIETEPQEFVIKDVLVEPGELGQRPLPLVNTISFSLEGDMSTAPPIGFRDFWAETR